MHANDPFIVRSPGRARLSRLAACVGLALASSGVAAAQGDAATITVAQACVVNADPSVGSAMLVNGAGFTPGESINLATTTGGASLPTMASTTGTFSVAMRAPTLGKAGPAASSFALQATDQATAAIVASTTFDVANLAVATNPQQGKPSKKVTWTFSGFTSGAQIYVHYLHGKQVIVTARFGKASGPCGTLKKKAKFFPGTAKYNSYKLQIDDSHRYSAKALPRLIATLKTHIPV